MRKQAAKVLQKKGPAFSGGAKFYFLNSGSGSGQFARLWIFNFVFVCHDPGSGMKRGRHCPWRHWHRERIRPDPACAWWIFHSSAYKAGTNWIEPSSSPRWMSSANVSNARRDYPLLWELALDGVAMNLEFTAGRDTLKRIFVDQSQLKNSPWPRINLRTFWFAFFRLSPMLRWLETNMWQNARIVLVSASYVLHLVDLLVVRMFCFDVWV